MSGFIFLLILVIFAYALAVNSYRSYEALEYHKSLVAKIYQWYKESNPDHVKGNRVTCNQCGGNRLFIRNLGGRMYLRVHGCVTCGANLYYSPE